MSLPDRYHVRYEHCRNYMTGPRVFHKGFDSPPMASKGGTTICYIENEDNQVVVSGMAVCSKEDQYNKKIGRAISLGRAMKELEKATAYNG